MTDKPMTLLQEFDTLKQSTQNIEDDHSYNRAIKDAKSVIRAFADKLEGEEILEKLAHLEHERWSRWMRWMFDNWTEENIARWEKQMVTPYADLPEHSKESDRKEAKAALAVVREAIG